jgi:hypothetical protein
MNTEYSRPGSNVSSVGEMLQTNWIPLSLIGVGITWLVASNTGLTERIAKDKRVQTAGSRIVEIAGDLGIGGGTKLETRQTGQILGPDGRPLHSGDAGRDEGWVSQATGAARSAIISVREASSAVIDRASRYTDSVNGASEMANRAGQLAEKLGRDPWLIGVTSLVAGALLAVLLPPTRIEQEYINEAREEFRTRSSELGHQAAERIRELADPNIRSSEA